MNKCISIRAERLKILIKLSTSKIKNPVPIPKLIKILDISRHNFVYIHRLLVDNGIAIQTKGDYGNTVLLDINIKKLDEFIINTEWYYTIKKYIKFKDPLLHQP